MNDNQNTVKKLSIIIVTYNSQLYIKKCLDSIFKYNDVGAFLEVIVVDNSPKEMAAQLSALIQEYYPNQVKFIKNDKNGGYGQGNNLGIQQALGKYIAIMNPDITLTESLFQDAIQRLEADSRLGIIGYKQIGGLDLAFYFRPEFYFPILTVLLTKVCNTLGVFNQKFMFLSGAFFFTKKASFEKVGNFDENFFLYCEESDVTNRFLKSGFSMHYNGSKSYLHEMDSREKMSPAGFQYFLNSVLYYLGKFSFSKERYLSKLIFDLQFKKLLYTVRSDSKNKDIVEEHLKQIYAYKQKMK
jgi:GT2 family glycosyltransferase